MVTKKSVERKKKLKVKEFDYIMYKKCREEMTSSEILNFVKENKLNPIILRKYSEQYSKEGSPEKFMDFHGSLHDSLAEMIKANEGYR